VLVWLLFPLFEELLLEFLLPLLLLPPLLPFPDIDSLLVALLN